MSRPDLRDPVRRHDLLHATELFIDLAADHEIRVADIAALTLSSAKVSARHFLFGKGDAQQ
jgi:hypothetical protein